MANNLKIGITADGTQAKKELRDTAREFAEIGREAKDLEDLMGRANKQISNIGTSSLPAKKELREIQKIMGEMNLKGLSSTTEFTQLAQRAGQLKDSISDAAAATEAYANDNMKLQATVQGFQGIAAAGTVVTGVMGLLGSESEEVHKILLKVQAAQSILNGINTIANMLNKDSILMLRIKQIQLQANAAAQAKLNAATAAGTALTKANTAATAANATTGLLGMGSALGKLNTLFKVGKALVGGWWGIIAMIGIGVISWALSTDDATEATEKNTEAIERAKKTQESYVSTLSQSYAQQMTDYTKLKKEWSSLNTNKEKNEWIKSHKSELDKLHLSINNIESAENVFVNNTDKVVEGFRRRAQAAAYMKLLTDAYQKQIELEEKGQEALNKYGKSEGDTYSGSFKMDEATKYDRMQTANNGKYYSYDNGATWKYTAKGAAEYNKELWKQNTIMKDLNDQYIENNNNLKKYEAMYGQLAESDEKISSTTSKSSSNTKKDVEAAAGSLAAMKKQLSDLQQLMEKGLIPSNKIKSSIDTINKLKKDIEKKEVELGIKVLPKEGSLKDLQNKLQEKQNSLQMGLEVDENKAKREIEQLKKDIEKKEVELGIKLVPEPNSQEFINNTIKEKENLLRSKNLTVEAKLSLQLEINDLQKRLDSQLSDNLTIPAKVEPKYLIKGSEEEIRKSIENGISNIQDIEARYDLGLIDYKSAKREIEKINSEIVNLGGKPVFIEIQSKFDKNLESLMNGYSQFDSLMNQIDGVVNSFDNLDRLIEEGANDWKIFMGVISTVTSIMSTLESVIKTVEFAQKLLGITTKTTTLISNEAAQQDTANTAQMITNATGKIAAKEGEAIAGATAGGAAMPFPYSLIAIAAGIAAVLAAFAMIAGFANGGVVGGNSFVGDKVLARVNSGEMILNGKQQSNLFRMIDAGYLNRQATENVITFGEARLRGSDMYLSMKNYCKTNHKKMDF